MSAVLDFTRVTNGHSSMFPALLRRLPCLPSCGGCDRCRLSASPATGLVGMQENAFLGDYFGCMGFMPLTTQRYCCCAAQESA